MGELRPNKTLGSYLKNLREQAKESLIEVSQAVEIDTKSLQEIESGNKLPDEEILSLLMSHFNISGDESARLWELAGFDQPSVMGAEEQILKQIMMVVPIENRVVYTDRFNVEANKNGVVINFLLGDSNQTVSRVGMSTDAAKQLVLQIVHQINQASSVKSIKPLLDMPNSKPKKTN